VKNGLATSGETILFEQGMEMLRPSRLSLSAKLAGDKVTEVFVGGRTIPVATGRFFLP
jgi:trans-2,3-dihydro-3-hydroxyanthranilate isomerase